jgi:hypothetical protein
MFGKGTDVQMQEVRLRGLAFLLGKVHFITTVD